jgi:PAS domain S-box-containing protein
VRWLRRIARTSAIFVALIALIALVGWFTGRRRLASVGENFIPMAPNTALSFILLSPTIFLLARGGTWRRRIGIVAAAIIAVVVLLRLAEYATDREIGVDRWLFRFPGESLGLAPVGRMALFTALSFLLIAAAIVCAALRERWPFLDPFGRVFAIVVGFAGVLFMLGYAYGKPLMYSGQAIPMALNTAACFFLLGGGLSLLGVAGDIVERRKIASALTASEQLHRAVVQQAAEGITLVDAETLQILEVNQAFARLLGYPREDLVGRPISDFIVDSKESVAAKAQQTLESAGPTVVQRQYRRRDGTIVDVEKSATVLDLAGRRVMCTVIHDITERKRAHRLLEAKNVQLEQAIASEREAHHKLKETQSALVQAEKLAGLGQMVAGVAHEINNPLSFVSNNVAVLERDAKVLIRLLELYACANDVVGQHNPQLAEEIRDLSDRIDLAYTLSNMQELTSRSREGLKRIQQIVRDLRDFARLDQGDQNDVDLNAGIESTINIIVGRAKKKRVQLVTDLGKLPTLTCHAAKLNQVVMNLVANAIDASHEGGTVTVKTSADNGQIRIAVQDAGHGIDPTIRQRIFDPFFTTKPVGEGTGLGLSISYGIVRDHGGRIDVNSTPGQGSTFTILLPVKQPVRKEASSEASP